MTRLEDLEWQKKEDKIRIADDVYIDIFREGWITIDTTDENQHIVKLDTETLKPQMLIGEVKVKQFGCSARPDFKYPLFIQDTSKATIIDLEDEMDD